MLCIATCQKFVLKQDQSIQLLAFSCLSVYVARSECGLLGVQQWVSCGGITVFQRAAIPKTVHSQTCNCISTAAAERMHLADENQVQGNSRGGGEAEQAIHVVSEHGAASFCFLDESQQHGILQHRAQIQQQAVANATYILPSKRAGKRLLGHNRS